MVPVHIVHPVGWVEAPVGTVAGTYVLHPYGGFRIVHVVLYPDGIGVPMPIELTTNYPRESAQ